MKPSARLIIDGRDVSTAVFGSDGVLASMTITDEAGIKADCLELELDDREGFKAPRRGTEIKVWLGYEPQPVYMGRYRVDEWTKGGPLRTLTVTARSAELTTVIRAAKTRAWDKTTVGEIVKKIAGEHSLSAVIAPKIAALKIEHIDQQSESDVGFLSRLARRSGATFKLADGKVLMAEKGSSTLPSGKPKAVITLRPTDGGRWSATEQGRGDYSAVKCCYMDHGKGKRVFVTAGSGKPCHTDRRLYGSADEARRAATAQLGELTRAKITMSFEGEGNTDMFAEAEVQAVGFDPDVDGQFMIKTVTHTLDGSGYRTSLALESKGVGDIEASPSE